MSQSQHVNSVQPPPRTVTDEGILLGTTRLREILASIRDLSQEGFPYQDAARAKVELQVRECVRQIFGTHSPEFQAYRNYRLHISTSAEVEQSIAAIEQLLQTIQHKQTAPSPALTSTSFPTSLHSQHPTATDSFADSSAAFCPSPPITQPQLSHHPSPSGISTSTPRIHASMISSPSPSSSTPPQNQTMTKVDDPSPSSPPVQATSPSSAVPISPSLPPRISATQRIARSSSPAAVSSDSTSSSTIGSLPYADPPGLKLAPTVSSFSPSLHLIRKICLRLHAVACQLRLRKDSRPTFEINDDDDVRDLLRALLKIEFDEVSTETWTSVDNGNTPLPFLFLNEEGITVIARKTRAGVTPKNLADQITADAAFYANYYSAGTLFYFVYDPEGRIGSPKQFEMDLTQTGNGYTVEVLVAPK